VKPLKKGTHGGGAVPAIASLLQKNLKIKVLICVLLASRKDFTSFLVAKSISFFWRKFWFCAMNECLLWGKFWFENCTILQKGHFRQEKGHFRPEGGGRTLHPLHPPMYGIALRHHCDVMY
jgi:hypothetical protein